MTEFVHVGAHADILASGRGIGRGDRVTEKDLDLDREQDGEQVRGHDQYLLDDGALVDVESFAPPPEDPTEQTLRELKIRAAHLDIEGRSKMNADQLAAAITEHERGVANAS